MIEVPIGSARSLDRSASSIISANTLAKIPEYGMATARMPVTGDSPVIWISKSAQNSSCTERRNAHRIRIARSRAKDSANRKPVVAPHQSQHEAAHLGPRVECTDLEVRQHKRERGNEQEQVARR